MADTVTEKSELGSIWIFKRVLQDDVDYFKLTPKSEFVSAKDQAEIQRAWEDYDEEPKRKKYDKSGKVIKRKWATWLHIRFDKNYADLALLWDKGNNKKTKDVNYDWTSIPLSWQKSFFAQQEAMLIKFSKSNFKVMEFGRDNKSFMGFISGLVKPLGISQKDTWNPADIWIVDKSKEKNIEKELEDITSFNSSKDPGSARLKEIKLQMLNRALRAYYANQTIIGVSLKLTSLKADYIDVNIVMHQSGLANLTATKQRFLDIKKLMCEVKLISCDLSIKDFPPVEGSYNKAIKEIIRFDKKYDQKNYPIDPKSFGNKGTIIDIYDPLDDKNYILTIQATSTSHVNNLKYEPTDKGKSSARLGKAGVDQVSNLFKSYKLDFVNDQKLYPKNFRSSSGKINNEIKRIISAYLRLQNKETIKSVATSARVILKNFEIVFEADIATAHSKLMQLDLLTQLLKLPDDDRAKIFTDIVYIAKKEGSVYGPFGKVY
jgi:hypothetical protein